LLILFLHVELNPVGAGLAKEAWLYKWSSAAPHIEVYNNGLVRVEPLLELMADWRSFLEEDNTQEEMGRFRVHGRTGRPLGDEAFLGRMVPLVCSLLRRRKSEPNKKDRI